jgi:DNA-binding NtrC family response regulator
VDRAVVLATGDVIQPDQLPAPLLRSRGARSNAPPAPAATDLNATADNSLRSQLRDLKRERIVDALARCAGNQTQAAKLLGVSRRTLVTLLDEFELPRPRRPSG